MSGLTEKPSKAQELQRDQAVTDLEAVLRIPHGRRALLRILERCGVYRSGFTGDDAATNMRCGEQNIGLWLISQLELVDPTEYPRLLLEVAQKKDRSKESVDVLDVDEE